MQRCIAWHGARLAICHLYIFRFLKHGYVSFITLANGEGYVFISFGLSIY